MSIQSINNNISRTRKEISDLEKKIVQESKKIHDLSKRINYVNNSINSRLSESSLKSKINEIERKQSEKVKLEIKVSDLLTKKTDKSNKLLSYNEQLRKEVEKEQKKQKVEDERERKKIEADDKKKQKEELAHQKKIQAQELAHERKIQQERRHHEDKILKTIQEQSNIQNNSPRILESETETIQYDIFLSHASEDKTDFVKPLALKLQELGFKVWYDEFTLKVGDSLRKKIDEGLKNSRYGTIIISESFIKKDWTGYELDSMVAREMNGHKMILPIWHKVSKDDVINFSPNLADKVALNSLLYSIEEIANKLAEVLKSN